MSWQHSRNARRIWRFTSRTHSRFSVAARILAGSRAQPVTAHCFCLGRNVRPPEAAARRPSAVAAVSRQPSQRASFRDHRFSLVARASRMRRQVPSFTISRARPLVLFIAQSILPALITLGLLRYRAAGRFHFSLCVMVASGSLIFPLALAKILWRRTRSAILPYFR